MTIDGRLALNQCRWHQTGHHISVGDNAGRIHLYEVGEVCNDSLLSFIHGLSILKECEIFLLFGAIFCVFQFFLVIKIHYFQVFSKLY